MNEREIRARVEENLDKRDRGEKLTQKEETVLAYAYYAAGEQRVRVCVDPDAGK